MQFTVHKIYSHIIGTYVMIINFIQKTVMERGLILGSLNSIVYSILYASISKYYIIIKRVTT